jgi:uncharacterized protein YaaN involved in tellurite resistance
MEREIVGLQMIQAYSERNSLLLLAVDGLQHSSSFHAEMQDKQETALQISQGVASHSMMKRRVYLDASIINAIVKFGHHAVVAFSHAVSAMTKSVTIPWTGGYSKNLYRTGIRLQSKPKWLILKQLISKHRKCVYQALNGPSQEDTIPLSCETSW